jgi:hypothetical protein
MFTTHTARTVAKFTLFTILFSFTLIAGITPIPLLAEVKPEYVPLVALPQFTGSGDGLSGYFNQIYMVCVAVGSIIAFIKISIAGVKWSMSDVVTDKSDARNDIKGALLGLIILLIPFIVLNTIYPGLTSLNILERAGDVRVK